MSQQKHYFISWEGVHQDGNPVDLELQVTLTGSLGTNQESYLTRLLDNFADGVQTILRGEGVDFSRSSQVSGPEN
jgi:hypothetical protein